MTHFTVEINLGYYSQLQTVQTQLLRFVVSPMAVSIHAYSRSGALLCSELSLYWKSKGYISLPAGDLKANSFVSSWLGSNPRLLWTIHGNGIFMLDYVINVKNVSCIYDWNYLQ